MNALTHLLSQLRRAGIKLWTEGGKLKFSAPPGALTPALRDQVVTNKPALIALLEQQAETDDDGPGPQAADRKQPLPTASAQQRLWFLEQLDGPSATYHIPLAWRLEGRIDAGALQQALDTVIQRHENLRTRYERRKGRPYQVIEAEPQTRLQVSDLRKLPPANREPRLQEGLTNDMQQPFDLAAAPPWRISLWRLGDTEQVLALTAHHMVADGAALILLFRELAACYNAARRQTKPDLAPLPLQYADFAVWQQQNLESNRHKRALQFWRKTLRDLPPRLDLPTDYPRPVHGGREALVHRFAVNPELWQRLQHFCTQRGHTPFTVLLAAYKVLLARTAGQNDIVVGTPVANRDLAVWQPLIGLFINTLVLRSQLNMDQAFADWLPQLRDSVLQAREHGHVPFDKLVQITAPERRHGDAPLFQTLFNLELETAGDFDFDGLRKTPHYRPTVTAKFDLLFSIKHAEDGAWIVIEVPAAAYERDTVTALGESYCHLLDALLHQPNQSLQQAPLLPAHRETQLVQGWNQTQKDHGTTWLPDLVRTQAARTPDAVALVFRGEQRCYRDFDQAVDHLAAALHQRGIGRENIVGICLERGFDMVIAIHAVLRAGAAYLPLDPELPKQRLAAMVDQAQPALILTHEAFAALLPSTAPHLALDTNPPAPATFAAPALEGGHAAYLIFTSGSTGQPKGVLVEHRAIHNRIQWMQDAFPLQHDDVVLQKTPFSFDVSVWEFLWPLSVGARLVVAEPGDHRDNRRLCSLIQQEQVTTLHFVPFMLRAFLECDAVTDCISLRRVFASGEALDEALRRRYHQCLAADFFNLYGPTEAAVDVSFHDCTPARREGVVPIGRPIDNLTLYIVDEQGRPVPRGVHGELMIGGLGLARGYIGAPARTAERFVPDPFSDQPGARLYRTGDRARFLSDGSIAFLGRNDFQVKIRGFRLELGEIETLLTRYPGVGAAAVALHTIADNPHLIAWLQGDPETLEPASIQAFMSESLPSHMIPAQFIVRADMPTTSSGKLDRNRLPSPEQAQTATRRYRAPSTTQEQQMCAIWAALLGLPRIGVDDSFFHAGGHSLLATQAVSLIAERMQARLELRDLFAAPTVAEAVQRLQPLQEEPGVSPLQRRTRPAVLPLSFAQQRLWFLERLEAPGPTYNMPAALRIRGNLDMKALFTAVETIIDRHESLRTNFTEVDHMPVQIIHAHQQLEVRRRDLRGLDPDARESAAHEWLQDQANQPFNLEEDALFRMALAQLGERDWVLLVVMHHIVSDGWSQGVLVREFIQLYDAFAAGKPSPLPPLPLQYADFALWQREKMDAREVQRHLAYWAEQLRDIQPLELPTDRPRTPIQSHRGDTTYFELEPETLAPLQALSRDQGVSLFMTLLSAFYILLGRYAGQDDIAVGSPIANRTRRELEGMIGFFVNTLVLRANLSESTDFTSLLAQVKDMCLAAYTHQDLPFEHLADELNPDRDLSRPLWFQVMFNVQQGVPEANSLGDLDVNTWLFTTQTAKFDLTFALHESDTGLYGSMEFNRDLFDRETVDRLLAHYATLLRHIAAAPNTPLNALRLEEPEALVAADHPLTHATWPDWFETVARTHPQRLALDDGQDQLTYAELDQRVNQRAQVLRDMGVARGRCVALALPRGIDFVVSALAVLKADGFYLPLDTHTPAERINQQLADAEPVLLLGSVSDIRLAASARCLTIDQLAERAAHAPGSPPPRENNGEDTAYLMYTSGSSGRPKGVLVPHRALVNHNQAALDLYELDPADRVSQFSSISFDISVEEIFATLVAGACLCPFPQDFDLTPRSFEQRIREQRLSVVNLPTAYWADWSRTQDSPPAGLRAVIIGGEACTPAALQHWRRKSEGRITLFNTYGPTETTIIATAWRDDPDQPIPQVVPIGLPIAGVTCQVLDPKGQPLPTGTPGELAIGGAGLAHGYHNQPAQTDKVFVTDGDGRRYYRSGDRVKRLADGNLVFLGRVDEQVKIRGYRVEPSEVAQNLQGLSGVGQSAVLVQHVEGQARLVGFYTSPTGMNPFRVRAALSRLLPRYMVPALLVCLDSLPTTTTGKVDRQALLGRIPDREAQVGQRRLPEGPTAQTIATIWESVLGVPHIGLDDNFFDLGGSSLPAVRVVTRLQAEWGVDLSIRTLFEAPQLEAFVFTVLRERANLCDEDELEALVAEVPEDRVETFLEALAETL
ncbi:non-ribosomal peptide synthetase [Acanthopleuribacter pedis]|uniref:Amino acid adenylation domain-containing protein n=1 Tax=Acanthopleuribacter pedis TaxID=442870 RepID=A0A8J7U399_9BACT|nr:non-ribosomal peptide synthetase [Acanthopleuribacter pedis]MBO1319412.1 amino acid adenylation domain-containing protein [Acanthopleuribacter pedis]